MFDSSAVTWTLTVVLLLCGSYHFLQTRKARQFPDRVNNTLHGVMHVLMAAMLWNLAPSTMLAQIAVLTGAALWFITQAVARPEIKIFCANGQGRLNCFHHSLTMAGAALMIVMMGLEDSTGREIVRPGGMSAMHGHHSMVGAVQMSTSAPSDFLPNLAILMTIIFVVTALIFFMLQLRLLAKATTLPNAVATRLSLRAGHGIEGLGAAVMALMFATMTA